LWQRTKGGRMKFTVFYKGEAVYVDNALVMELVVNDYVAQCVDNSPEEEHNYTNLFTEPIKVVGDGVTRLFDVDTYIDWNLKEVFKEGDSE